MSSFNYQSSGANNFIPKQDTLHGSSVFDKSTYNKQRTFKEDSVRDLYRWMDNFCSAIEEYTEEKYAYEKEKKLKNRDEQSRKQMKDSVSDDKGFLEDMRKGFDWFYNTFEAYPSEFKKFKKEYSIELKRLKKLKKYLSYRVRSLAGKGMYNEPSKDILQYLRIRIDAINILFDPKYNERTPLEDIYGIDKDEEDDDFFDGMNRNKIFSYD